MLSRPCGPQGSLDFFIPTSRARCRWGWATTDLGLDGVNARLSKKSTMAVDWGKLRG
jgi:hypothetical protein